MIGSNQVREEIFDFCILATPNPLKLIKEPTFHQQYYLSKYNNYMPVFSAIYLTENKHDMFEMFDYRSNYINNECSGLFISKKDDVKNNYVVNVAANYSKKPFLDENNTKHYLNNTIEHVSNITKDIVNKKNNNKITTSNVTEENPVKILHTKINNQYLPHCTSEDIKEGTPWKLFNMQGENQMWYTSALTCFDLTQSIINYNHKLLDQYDFDNMRYCSLKHQDSMNSVDAAIDITDVEKQNDDTQCLNGNREINQYQKVSSIKNRESNFKDIIYFIASLLIFISIWENKNAILSRGKKIKDIMENVIFFIIGLFLCLMGFYFVY